MKLTPEMLEYNDYAKRFLNKYYKGQITGMKWERCMDNKWLGTLIVKRKDTDGYMQYVDSFIKEVIDLKVPKKLFLEYVQYILDLYEENEESKIDIQPLNLNDYLCSK